MNQQTYFDTKNWQVSEKQAKAIDYTITISGKNLNDTASSACDLKDAFNGEESDWVWTDQRDNDCVNGDDSQKKFNF